MFDPDGTVLRDSNGDPVRHHTGLLPDAAKGAGNVIKAPVQTTLYWAGGVVVVLLTLFGASKVWKHSQKDRLELEAARSAAKASNTTRSASEGPTEQ